MLKLVIVIISLLVCVPALAAQGKLEVWIAGYTPQELGRSPQDWQELGKDLHAVCIFINTIAFLCPQDELKSLVKVLNERKIKIGIECGYFDWVSPNEDFIAPNPKGITDAIRTTWDDTVGEETARIEMKKIQNLVDAGGTPAYLNLDGSIRRFMRPGQDLSRGDVKGFDSLDRSVDEFVDYLKAWRVKYPRIEFFLVPNLPNWGWKGQCSYWTSGMFNGDYYEALKKIVEKTNAAEIKIKGVTVDYPYDYFKGTLPHKPWLNYADDTQPTCEPKDPAKIDWKARLADLGKYVESKGMELGVMTNSQAGGAESAEAFSRDTMYYIDDLEASEINVRRCIIQTWYKYPEKMLPESEKYTLTWLTREIARKLKE